MEQKRINLKLNPQNEMHRKAIQKLENQSSFSSMTAYIVHAVLAYQELEDVPESRIRKIIREELKAAGVHRSFQSPKAVKSIHDTERAQIPKAPGYENMREEKEEEVVDPSTIDFMNELMGGSQ